MRSSNLPERSASSVNAFCLVLLRMGFSLLRLVTKCTVRSYRTFSPLPVPPEGGRRRDWFFVHLSSPFPRPAVSRHPALRSPDFPPRMPYAIRGDCLSDLYEVRIITQANHNRLTTKKTAYLKIYPFRNIKIQIK